MEIPEKDFKRLIDESMANFLDPYKSTNPYYMMQETQSRIENIIKASYKIGYEIGKREMIHIKSN